MQYLINAVWSTRTDIEKEEELKIHVLTSEHHSGQFLYAINSDHCTSVMAVVTIPFFIF